MTVLDIIRAGRAESCAPVPRYVLSRDEWSAMTAALANTTMPALLALWADTMQVHALFQEGDAGLPLIASVPVEAETYPALSPMRPAAAWFERMVRDLWGHVATGGRDDRPWLDHGKWQQTQPMALRPGPPLAHAEPPEFVTLPDATLMQIPLGPVPELIDEPMHLRVTARAEQVRRAEARLGYAHKGTLALLRGKSPRVAARFAARLSADATVAHALAFARATELALGVVVPPRAAVLRVQMLEQERIAGHLDDLARMAEEAGQRAANAAAGLQRELLLRAQERAFGHRLMMDCVVPGGVAADLSDDGVGTLRKALDAFGDALPALRARLAPLLSRLIGVGVIGGVDAAAWGAGGVVGRGAGRAFDARRHDPLYASCRMVLDRAGDAAARCRVRLAEIEESLRLARAWLDDLPEGAITVALPTLSGEGIGCVESHRGDIWHWLRLDHGQIAAAFPRDPGWALWPLAEIAMAECMVEDVTMIRLSCGLPASALDL